MRSSVLPEPAGACTMNERAESSARSRCSRSGARAISLIGVAFALRRGVEGGFLGDAAEHRLLAILAREFGPALRIDARVAPGEIPARRLELDAPALDE